MRSMPFAITSRGSPSRFAAPACAALIAVCAACPSVSLAQSMATADAPRVDVWGSAVDARERAEKAAFEQRAGDPAAQLQLLRGVSLQLSQWGGTAPVPQPVVLDGAARRDAVARSGPALQATDVSMRWGLGTSRSAVDVVQYFSSIPHSRVCDHMQGMPAPTPGSRSGRSPRSVSRTTRSSW